MYIEKPLWQNLEYSRKSILFCPENGADAIFLQIHTNLFWCEVVFSSPLKIGCTTCFRLFTTNTGVYRIMEYFGLGVWEEILKII